VTKIWQAATALVKSRGFLGRRKCERRKEENGGREDKPHLRGDGKEGGSASIRKHQVRNRIELVEEECQWELEWMRRKKEDEREERRRKDERGERGKGGTTKGRTRRERRHTASEKEGCPQRTNSFPAGKSRGAPEGRFPEPTAPTTSRILTTMESRPTQPIHLTEPRVLKEAGKKVITAETATKTAVQVPWRDMALKAVDMPRRAEPAIMVMRRK
jgi:hypothetical protein